MDTEATKKKKRSIVDKVFGGTFLNSVLCLTCKNVSRTVQRFTDVIVDLNFKEGHSVSHKYSNNYGGHNSYKMSKRDRKRQKNKKYKNNKKGKYFNQDYDYDYDTVHTKVKQAAPAEKPIDKPMLEYLLTEEEVKAETESLDPKLYYPLNRDNTILDEYDEAQEDEEDKSEDKKSDTQEDTPAEGEDAKEDEQTQDQDGEGENEGEENGYVVVDKEECEETEDKPEGEQDDHCEDYDVINNDGNKFFPQTDNVGATSDTESPTTQPSSELAAEDPTEADSAPDQPNLESVECQEGEDFIRSNLDFTKYAYYEPVEDNTSIRNKAKADTLEDALRFFVKSEHLTDEYYCENCIQSNPEATSKAVRKTLFLKAPKNLVINIKRFTHTMYSVRKDSARIKFPLRMSLDKFMVKQVDISDVEDILKYDDLTASQDKPTDVYELYGVVSHSGGMSGGHYV